MVACDEFHAVYLCAWVGAAVATTGILEAVDA